MLLLFRISLARMDFKKTECLGVGGRYQGDSAECEAAVVCEVHACCLGSGDCTERMTYEECADLAVERWALKPPARMLFAWGLAVILKPGRAMNR